VRNNSKQKVEKVVYFIVNHFGPDLETGFCDYLLLNTREAENKYPGIRNAKIKFVSVNQKLDDYTENEILHRYIHVDCGGVDYDHHQDGADTLCCSADKILLDLGIKDPAIFKISRVIRSNDLNGTAVSDAIGLDLFTIIRGANLRYPDDPEIVVEKMMDLFEDLYEHFIDVVQAEKDLDKLRVTEVKEGDRVFRIGSIYSDAANIVPVIRKEGGASLDIVIVQNSEDYARILKSSQSKASMKMITTSVCFEEIFASELGCRLTMKEILEELKTKNRIQGIPHWYLFKFRQLINGGPKNPDAPPTSLNLGQLLRCVINALKEQIRIEKLIAERKASKEMLETSTKEELVEPVEPVVDNVD